MKKATRDRDRRNDQDDRNHDQKFQERKTFIVLHLFPPSS